MGIIERIRYAFQNRTISQVQLVTEQGNRYMSWNGKVYDSDIVRACMRPKVKAIGKLVGKHIRKTLLEDGTTKIDVNPAPWLRMLLEEPNPLMTGQMLQEKLANQLCINNNAFVLICRDDMNIPIALYPIAPRTAEAVYAQNGELSIRFTLPNNKIYTFPYTDIIHIRQDYNENDIFGSPIAPALTPLLDVVTTTDQGIMNAIRNSSVIRWLLKFTSAMRPEDLKKQAKDFAQNYLETSTSVGVAATDAKMDASQISQTDYVPNASQMDRTTSRIYALFNTSENIVNSTRSEDEWNAYFDAEVEPVLIQLSGEYSRKLLTRRERGFGNKIVFEASSWDSASMATKLNLAQMVDRGALTPNEWRETFNLAPVEGGDKPIRRLDTAAVSDSEDE